MTIKKSTLLSLCACVALTACAPNLIIEVSSTPSTFAQGDEVIFTWSMKNIGNATAEQRPAYTIAAPGQVTVHGAPSALGISIKPGASTPPKKYVWFATKCGGTIKIVADPNNDIVELNEDDNVWQKNLEYPVCSTVLEDLAITKLIITVLKKYTKDRGEVEISATATNLGGGVVKNDGNLIVYMVTAKGDASSGASIFFKANTIMSGGQITVSRKLTFSSDCGNLHASPVFKALITYGGAWPGGKTHVSGADANPGNNSLERGSQVICDQLK